MADVESMYYQVMVPDNQQSFLKFLWGNNGNLLEEPQDFVMCAHVFGGTSSAKCSNYVLTRTAVDNQSIFGKCASETLQKNFYVDELLKSSKDVEAAKELVKDVMNMCKSGGFHLTEFISNSNKLFSSIPESQRRIGVKDQDPSGQLPTEKAFGICWEIGQHPFTFKIQLDERPLTKRVMLSVMSSIYDHLGFAAPFVLEGRRILQSLFEQNVQWDVKVCNDVQQSCNKWKRKLKQIELLHVQRCFKPADFGEVSSISLHHFSDASEIGYGQCSYIRMVRKKGQIHCCLLFGKARVIPKKFVSIPRLELTAVTLSIKVASLLKKELDLDEVEERFWTDSKVVLCYIADDVRRF